MKSLRLMAPPHELIIAGKLTRGGRYGTGLGRDGEVRSGSLSTDPASPYLPVHVCFAPKADLRMPEHNFRHLRP
jgi:hypothetical protein